MPPNEGTQSTSQGLPQEEVNRLLQELKLLIREGFTTSGLAMGNSGYRGRTSWKTRVGKRNAKKLAQAMAKYGPRPGHIEGGIGD